VKKELGNEAAGLTKPLFDLRFNHIETRRQEKIKILLEERQAIQNEEAQGLWHSMKQISGHESGVAGGVSSQHGYSGKKASSMIAGSKLLSGNSAGS